jgi:protocatechuate 3,4-dioxygenase beta subunit
MDGHDQGLFEDLAQLTRAMKRRDALRWIAGATLLPALGCAAEAYEETVAPDGTTCTKIPEETAGPYPGDGSNGPNALTTSGIVRSDITTSFGSLSGTAAGVPLTIKLKLVDTSNACATVAGYAVYLWHCDQNGLYSLYTVANQNYLRGVQESDANGIVTFQSIFPGAYSGRWPHIHFEIYPSLATANAAGNKLQTSQLALPEAVCSEVYATTGYSASVRNLASTSLSSDNVFSDDDAEHQLAEVSGDVVDGFTATLSVGV